MCVCFFLNLHKVIFVHSACLVGQGYGNSDFAFGAKVKGCPLAVVFFLKNRVKKTDPKPRKLLFFHGLGNEETSPWVSGHPVPCWWI